MSAKKTIHNGFHLGPRHEGPKLDPLCLLLIYIYIERERERERAPRLIFGRSGECGVGRLILQTADRCAGSCTGPTFISTTYSSDAHNTSTIVQLHMQFTALVSSGTLKCRLLNLSSDHPMTVKIHQSVVQWKQGVVVHIIL